MSTVVNEDGRKNVQNQFRPAQNYISPRVNISGNADGYTIQAETPGVNKDGVELTLEGTELTIIGRRVKNDFKGETLYRESSTADYRVAFELDPAIDTDRIDAKIDQGILTIQLPKSDRVKPRKIAVNG